ncbi:hypothetical protein ABIA39_006550 [Nocardia sp. GAS34]
MTRIPRPMRTPTGWSVTSATPAPLWAYRLTTAIGGLRAACGRLLTRMSLFWKSFR